MRRLSLSEAARHFDISKGYLSRRTHEGKSAKGYELHQYAVMDDGEIVGFDLPRSMLPSDTRGESTAQNHKSGDGSLSQAEKTGKQTKKRFGNVSSASTDERENPGEIQEAVTASLAAYGLVDVIKDFVEDLRSPLQDADPEEATVLLDGLKRVAMEIAPIAAGAAWAYTHRKSDDVSQLGGALLAAAGVDILVHGHQSIFVRAINGDLANESDAQHGEGMAAFAPTANEVAREFMGGDGAALNMDVGLDRVAPQSTEDEDE